MPIINPTNVERILHAHRIQKQLNTNYRDKAGCVFLSFTDNDGEKAEFQMLHNNVVNILEFGCPDVHGRFMCNGNRLVILYKCGNTHHKVVMSLRDFDVEQ